MKKLYLFFLLTCLCTIPFKVIAKDSQWPQRPIRIVVYTDAGGLIDVTARKLANHLESELGQSVIVENKKGAGGIVALNSVLKRPADGYTIFGLTSSVISKVTQAKQDNMLLKLHYLARIVDDHECLIVRNDSGFESVESLVKAAGTGNSQIWAGPAVGGTDHLFAQKFWKASNMKAKWIPYKSGAKAIAALMGGHADVYVGNPQDAAGRPNLKVLAIAAPQKLSSHPHTATFVEQGYTTLSNEVLWRGFALRQGTPQPIVQKLESAFRKASQKRDWTEFVTQAGMISVFDTGNDFFTSVKNQIAQDKKLLM